MTESFESERRHANMGGVQAGIAYRVAGKVFEQLEGYWEKGNPHAREIIERPRQLQRYQVLGRLGATAGIGCCCSVLATPYGGYGFRWIQDTFRRQDFPLERDGAPVIVTKPQIRFTYGTYFVPLGGIVTLNMGGCLEVGVLAEYQIAVQSLLKVQVDNNGEDRLLTVCRWRLPRQRTWTVEVPIRAKLGPCCVQLEVAVVPYYIDEKYGRLFISDFFTFGDDPVLVPARRQLTAGIRVEVGIRI